MNPNQNNSFLQDILSKLKKVKYIGSGRYMAECPAHQDEKPSLSIVAGDDGRVLLKCHAGCVTEDVVKAIGLEMKDLFSAKKRQASPLLLPKKRATVQRSSQVSENKGKKECCSQLKQEGVACTGPSPTEGGGNGCTLQQYATLKRLSVPFLREIGLSNFKYAGKDVVRIPYYSDKQKEVSVQYRIALQGNDKFRWRKGDKPTLYGLNYDFKSKGYVILSEGPSDTQTLWYNDFSALGLPSASTWNEQRDASLLVGINSIFVVIEPDQGGIAIRKWLSVSCIRDRVKLLILDGYKDPSALFLHDRENFKANMESAMSKAISWTEVEIRQMEQERDKAWTICKSLAGAPDILSLFAETIKRVGVAGQEKEIQTLYLMLNSRHQKRPVSAVVKGQSAGGKSFIVEQVLRFFPVSSYKELTAMSEHTLAYGEEPLSNRYLILFEIAGISNEIANYLLRSLLSEGRVLYETVEKDTDGKLKVRRIERPGPTGAIITTTQIWIHPENETRLLSINISDSKEQTRDIMLALSEEEEEVDLSEWKTLQSWIDLSEHRVVIPYAKELANLIPPLAVRLRRDFTQVLNLIRSHAVLHQANRKRDPKGKIVAEIADYAVVRRLIFDILSEGVEATVSPVIRETVAAVNTIIIGTDLEPGKPCATVVGLARVLKVDKSTASRRYAIAKKRGYLVNNEKVRGKSAQIVIGDPLPDDLIILPCPGELECCTVAAIPRGEREDASSSSECDESGLPGNVDISFPPGEIDLQGKVIGVVE